MHSLTIRIPAIACAAGALLLLTGCFGRPGRVKPPAYSLEAGTSAVYIYDTNGDQLLSDLELDSVPALRESLGKVDTNSDNQVSASEIDSRIQAWRDSKVAEMGVICRVTLDGIPIPDAVVQLEPEKFLGENLHPASGTTTADGQASVSMAGEHLADPQYPGVACGWYKIRVTCSTQEIPPNYNTSTTLGCEVAMDAHWVHKGEISVKLTSK